MEIKKIYWTKSKNLRTEIPLNKNGVGHGLVIEYFSTGTLSRKIAWKEGTWNNVRKEYNIDGMIYELDTWQEDGFHGVAIDFYYQFPKNEE